MLDEKKPKFEVGDRVKIWRILHNPIGTVMAVESEEEIVYSINYIYHDGREFTENFKDEDLTLHEKSSKGLRRCNCGVEFTSSGGKHSEWCPLKGTTYEGKVNEQRKIQEPF